MAPPQTRRWLKRLRRALTWADTYLDMLVKLIPRGDATKELKDAAGAATDDAIDAADDDHSALWLVESEFTTPSLPARAL